jgi:protein-disulfide isomerase
LEFTDYQCPYCRIAHQDVRRFLAQHSNSVRLIHKHYPLDNQCNRSVKGTFHERACKFTICAGKQGKFWPANDAIFTALGSQTAQELNLEEISTQIQADWTTLRQCMSDTATDQALQEVIEEGIKRGVRATPTYFVNDRRFEGKIPPEVLKELGKSNRFP